MRQQKLLFSKKSLFTSTLIYLFSLCAIAYEDLTEKSVQQQTLNILASDSADQSGLIQFLAKSYESKNSHLKINVKTGGTLLILEQARHGDTGLVISHHPSSEKLFIDEGYGLSRTLIMYNQFALFGPPGYQASKLATGDLMMVLRQLAEKEVPFMVPGVQSGTQQKLTELWSLVGVKPDWPGYEITGSSSATTLRTAAIFGAYAFADIATYLAHRKQLAGALVPIYRDHSALRNYYSAIVVNGERFNHLAQQKLAQEFLQYLISDEGQSRIRQFGETTFHSAVFTPAAHLDIGLKAHQAQLELKAKQRNLQLMSGLSAVLGLLALMTTWLFIRTRKLQHSTKLSRERFALAVAGSSDGIWDWNIQDNLAYFSSRVNEILGLPAAKTSITDPIMVLKGLINRNDRGRVLDALRDYLDGESDDVFCTEFRLKCSRAGNDLTWVMMRGKALRNDNKPVRMSGSITDITDSKLQKAAIEYQAMHDSLTGLPNRVLLHDRLRQVVSSSERNNHPFALLMMDLNRFKEVNDTLGHHIGDEVLEHVAQRLKKILRKSDTVARLGGDEFAILLNDANMTYANHVAQKVILTMKKVFELKGHSLYVGGSVGISVFPQHGQDPQTLVQHADVAMYVAKRNNTGVAIYESSQDQHSMRRLSLEKDLHEAIDNNKLQLYYQPKVDLGKKTVTGVEALLRWDHPQLGMISPVEMIEIAEQTGLIKPLTKWLLATSMQQLAEWRSVGLDLNMAVNLSIWNLQDRVLLHDIEYALEVNQIEPNRLELEITESTMIADINRTVDVLNRLSQMGVKLAIDDYGTGFSSLSYLKKLSVDFLKIDKSFVLGMVGDLHDASIVKSTIELAHNIGLKVVAEGVEDHETLSRLAAMGCEIAQGYYFARPLPREEVPRWMKISPWGFSMPHEIEQQAVSKQELTTVH